MQALNKFTSSIWSILVWATIIFVLANQVACGPFIKDIHDLQASQAAQDSRLNEQEALLNVLESQLVVLHSLISAIDISNQDAFNVLEAQIHDLTAQVAALNGYNSIVAVLDPCGDTAGVVDEVLLKLSNGQVLASFSDKANGKNTRFSILSENVTYQTTDGSNCTFKIVNGAVVH